MFQDRQRESGMSKAGLDNRKQDGEIGHKHGATPIGTLRKIYGQGFAAGYPPTDKLSDVFVHLNETSLSQLRRDYKTGHLAIGDKKDKATWRKPRGIRLTPTSRYIRDKLFPKRG
jgi:hypothetical protein